MSELIDIFREEVDTNLKEATRLVLELEQADTQAPEHALTEALMRVFHTLKGAARAIGFDQEKQIAHRLEDVYHDLLDGKTSYRGELPDLSLYAIDLFHDTVEARLTETALPGLEHLERQVDDYRAGRAPRQASPDSNATAETGDQSQPSPPPIDGAASAGSGGSGGSGGAAPTTTTQSSTQTPPKPAAPAATLPDGLDLLGIFSAQVQGHLSQARAELLDYAPDTADAASSDNLRRVFHTIKGAARAIGFIEIRDAAAAIEELFRDLGDGPAASTPSANDALAPLAGCALDLIEIILAAHVAGTAAPSIEPLRDQVARYRRGEPIGDCAATRIAASAPPPEPPQQPLSEPAPVPPAPAEHNETPADHTPEPARRDAGSRQPSTLAQSAASESLPPIPGLGSEQTTKVAGTPRAAPRTSGTPHPSGHERATVAYEQLDRLYRLSGELTVSVSALAGQRRQMRTLALELSHAQNQLSRIGGLVQTDGLARETLQESLRGIAERLTRAASECTSLSDVHDRMESRLQHLSDDLVDEVTQARLVPLSELLDDYPRMLRDLAHELGKRVELRIDGADNRIDRAVLERLRDPLRHMVRNALGHGIEPADERRRAGKAESGHIVIEARQLGSMMRIRVADDGRGINLERLQQTVVAHGHTTAAMWAAMGIDEQMQFLFLPGLSTAIQVDTTQGRGFGLDIVKNAIDASGGHIGVHSEHNQGTCFELQVPLMLSLTRCLLVYGGQHPLFGAQRYAFPMSEVAAVRRIAEDQLRDVEGRMAVHLDDEMLLLYELHQVLGLAPLEHDIRRKHLLILGEGERRYGLLAEEVIDEMNMVSRPLDQRLGKVRDVSGLTLLDDGGVALIIDIPDLIARMEEGSGRLSHAVGQPTQIAEPVAEADHILVVEDSVTVREVERHFLEQAGYQVTTAVNGVDGLNKAKTGNFDLLITDIDMPRMNGIELISTLRGIDRFQTLPIIVVSYKDRAEDRQKTLDAGADRYVTKSEFDTDAMLDLVAEMLGT